MIPNDHGQAWLNNDSHAVRPVEVVDLALVESAFFNLAPRGEASVVERPVVRGWLSELLDFQTFVELVDFREVLVDH